MALARRRRPGRGDGGGSLGPYCAVLNRHLLQCVSVCSCVDNLLEGAVIVAVVIGPARLCGCVLVCCWRDGRAVPVCRAARAAFTGHRVAVRHIAAPQISGNMRVDAAERAMPSVAVCDQIVMFVWFQGVRSDVPGDFVAVCGTVMPLRRGRPPLRFTP